MARLLVCLLPVGCAMFGAVSSAAAASPPAPKLVTTDPVSTGATPATSLTPSVLGEAEPEDGVIIEAFPGRQRSVSRLSTSAVKTPTKNPGYEIQIFSGTECPGVPIATGTAGELEEAGIPVTVASDVKTVLSARQVNPGAPLEPSGCSNPLSYWEGNVPPENEGGGGGGAAAEDPPSGGSQAPVASPVGGSLGEATPVPVGKPDAPRIHTSPGARANDVNPLIVGSAPGSGTVSIFENESCSGSPVAKGAASELASGFQVSVPSNSVTTFSAMAFGSQHSSCSLPTTYAEDSLAPRTRITMGPGVKTRKRKAVFRFQDVTEDPPGTTFRCRVDKAQWKPCISPFHQSHLKLGHHVLAIRATDLAGNVEPKPVKRSFTVVPPSGS